MAALYASSAVGIGIICTWIEAVFWCHFTRNQDKVVICQWIESVLVTNSSKKGIFVYKYMHSI